MFKNKLIAITYPFPFDPPFIDRDNPVGSYVRTFNVPSEWKDGSYLEDAVNAAHHLEQGLRWWD